MQAKSPSFGTLDKDLLKEGIRKSYTRLTMSMLHYLEDCVGCMACRVGCPFAEVNEKYIPVNKAEELRNIYRKEITVAGKLLGSLAKAKYPERDEDVERMAELAYKCSNCSTCYTVCPFGIDSGSLINVLRSILTSMGTVPTNLKVAASIEAENSFDKYPEILKLYERGIAAIRDKLRKDVPLDGKADFVYIPSVFELMMSFTSVINTAYILEKIGLSWTMPSKPLLFKPFLSWSIGNYGEAIEIGRRVEKYVESAGARTLVVSDGGMFYYFMRWIYPEALNKPVSFDVKHITELVYESFKTGKLSLKRDDEKVTYHSPCKLGRKGGVIKEPIEVLKAVSSNFKELPHKGIESLCCGGGDGVALLTSTCTKRLSNIIGIDLSSAISDKEKNFMYKQEKIYYLQLGRKAEEIKKVKPETVVVSCPTCQLSLSYLVFLYDIDFKIKHFSDVIAEKLA